MAHGIAQGPTPEVDRLCGPAFQNSVFPVRVLVVISRCVGEDPQGVRRGRWLIGITPLTPDADLVGTG